MKYLLAIIMALFSTYAFGMTALWDTPTTGGTPTGYVLEWTDGTTVNTKTVIGATQTVIDNKYFEFDKQYTFKVYAYNDAGRSDYSNSVVWTRPTYSPPVDTILIVKMDVPTVPGNARID